MKDHQYRWLAGGYDRKIGQFLEVASMVVTWWIVAFWGSVKTTRKHKFQSKKAFFDFIAIDNVTDTQKGRQE